MTYRAALVALCFCVPTSGCINDALDVGSLPSTGDGSAGETGEPEGSTGSSSGAETSAGSDGMDSGSSDSGELDFPECDPPLTAVPTYELPFEYEDAFLGSRRTVDCVVAGSSAGQLTLLCDDDPAPFDVTFTELDAVPLEVDEVVVLDEILETGPPQGYLGAGQHFSIRREDGSLALAGVDSAGLDASAEQFPTMPWEPELTLSRSSMQRCPVEADDPEDETDCGFDERVAIEVTDGAEIVTVLDGQSAQGLGYGIHVATAVDVHEPCIDNDYGDYRILIVSEP